MGQEYVVFKDKSFLMSSSIISWIQKFMELSLMNLDHPQWFIEVIDDLHSNFHMPYIKYFFDEDIIGNDKERLEYCIKMIDLTIEKMESITMKDFFYNIYDSIKGSWCAISHESFQNDWMKDNEIYKEKYIGSLKKLKVIMKES